MTIPAPLQNDGELTPLPCESGNLDSCHLERAIQGSNDGFWEWDFRTDRVWYAAGYLDLLNVSADEFPAVLESWRRRLHPEDRARSLEALRRHLEEDATYDIEYRLLPNGGDYRWFRARARFYRDSAGQPVCMSGSIRDVDDLRRAEKLLHEKEAQLVRQQKLDAIGSLAGGIAHEFNNLLQAIHGYTMFAKEALDEGSQPCQDLDRVLTASDRATLLTRQLLDYSRTDSTEPALCSADEIARDLGSLLRPLLPENIDFELRLDAPGASVLVDPTLAAQALMNLCINARDTMPEGGQLLVRSEAVAISEFSAEGFATVEPGDYLRFSVTDTGAGIPTDVQHHVFEPFFTTKEVGKGTGLGLAMAFGVAQRAGGHMRLHSEPGHGTTFQIYLPNHEEPAMDERAQSFPSGNGATVLLAEDDALVRDVGRRMLQRAGYRVIEACDGREAVDLYEAHAEEIDVLVLDVVMPRLSGREVFEQVRRLNSDVPICFCTGYDPVASQSDSLRSMGCQVVEKPFLEDQLLATVGEVLDNSKRVVLAGH